MKTVIHLTSGDGSDWGHALRSAALLWDHDELVHEDVTLLPHRSGIGLVAPDSTYEDDVADLIESGVTVTAGATCFDATGRPREALSGVGIVPSGVSELVRLQSEGYNYVKVP